MKSDAELITLLSNLPGMMDIRSACNIVHYLSMRPDGGDIVEFGCHQGHTAALMAAVTGEAIHLYDSFEGLPEKSPKDVTRPDFVPGYLKCDVQDVVDYFNKYALPIPIVEKSWFKDLEPHKIPGRIAFAHIDCDFYQSTLDALKLIYPRLTANGVCLIHDYGSEILQGVKPAVGEFLFDMINKDLRPMLCRPMSWNQYLIIR